MLTLHSQSGVRDSLRRQFEMNRDQHIKELVTSAFVLDKTQTLTLCSALDWYCSVPITSSLISCKLSYAGTLLPRLTARLAALSTMLSFCSNALANVLHCGLNGRHKAHMKHIGHPPVS